MLSRAAQDKNSLSWRQFEDRNLIVVGRTCLGLKSFSSFSKTALKGYGFCHPFLKFSAGKRDRLSITTLPGSTSDTASSPLKSVSLAISSAVNFCHELVSPSKTVSAYTLLESCDLSCIKTYMKRLPWGSKLI